MRRDVKYRYISACCFYFSILTVVLPTPVLNFGCTIRVSISHPTFKMNSPPGGRALSLANGNGTAFPTFQSNQYLISKKRKAHDPIDDDKENLDTPTTPRSKQVVEEDHRERTPGRDGPIKEEQRGLKPDIKPFKGPPGKKVRKTPYEKNEEYRQFCRENEGHPFHE